MLEYRSSLHQLRKGHFIRHRPACLLVTPRQLHLSPRTHARKQGSELRYAEEGDDEEEGEEPLLELSAACHLIIEDSFLGADLALSLRDTFDQRFSDPRTISPERFVWDYWHVPNQYTLIRTQAQVYFPSQYYEALVDALISFGEERLGCRAISPIWCSYYVDGCLQELHTDSYHGPFAFVLSLTKWDERTFRGGETMILKSKVLDYWNTFDPNRGLEQSDLVELIPPLYNRLTVFDPRFPHGVKRVSGTNDPREARLVLHGWFTQPEPFFSGGLSEEEASPVLEAAMEDVISIVTDLPCEVTGLLALRFKVDGGTGAVEEIEWLADTLIATSSGPEMLPKDQIRAGIQHVAAAELSRAKFPPSSDGSNTEITLPIVFS